MLEIIPEWALTPADEAEIAGLMARSFPSDFGGRSFFQTRHHLRLIHREAAILSHMALQIRAMRLGGRLVTVAGLAEVATDPAARGRGLAGGLLSQAIDLMRAGPVEHVLLFGDRPLYAAAGFRRCRNPMTWCDMMDARTGRLMREPAEALMVLPLKGEWDEALELDLVGGLF